MGRRALLRRAADRATAPKAAATREGALRERRLPRIPLGVVCSLRGRAVPNQRSKSDHVELGLYARRRTRNVSESAADRLPRLAGRSVPRPSALLATCEDLPAHRCLRRGAAPTPAPPPSSWRGA